jgi:hypothetical protein
LIKHSQKFLSIDPRCNCFAPLSPDATNFEKGYHKKRVTLFSIPQRQTNKQLANVPFAHKYTRNQIRVFSFVGRSVSKQQHSQQLQHKLLSFRLF